MNLHVPTDSLLGALVADSPEAIACFYLDGTVAMWNGAAEKLYGHAARDVLGRHFSLLFPLYELPAMEELLRRPHLPAGAAAACVERVDRNGSFISLNVHRSILRGPDGEPLALLERASSAGAAIAGTTAEAHLRLLMDQMPVVFWAADQRLRITSHGGSGFRGMNMFRSNSPGQTVYEYLRCRQDQETPVKQHLEALGGISSRFEYRRRKHVFDISLEPMRNAAGEIIGCIGVALDITDRKKSEEEIRFQASHDGLTALANYREFVDRLEHEARRADRSGRGFGLLLLDLNGLKAINDRMGHLTGNKALKRLARVLTENCRATDLAARYGGDEFGVLLIDADCPMTEHVAGRIRDGLRRSSETPPLGVSIGAAVYPKDGRSAQDLLEIADRRMYLDKQSCREQFQTVATR